MIASEAAWYVAKVGGGEEPWCCFWELHKHKIEHKHAMLYLCFYGDIRIPIRLRM